MFGIFKRRIQKDLLQKKYHKLMEEAHRLSKVNRKLSEVKIFGAGEIIKEIEKL